VKRRRQRPLRDDEAALWALATRTVVPRPGRTPAGIDMPPPGSAPPASDTPESDAATGNTGRAAAAAAATATASPGLTPLAPIDRRARQALRRGRQGIDAVLDLHGLRQEEAHAALRRFLARQQAAGSKLVLVVTGKGAAPGQDAAAERGILRRVVPHWLRQAELRGLVVGFDEAGREHGGAGALYVRLRRRRKASEEG
jgi:DNA-nicking Smr family endonuclease